MRRMTVTTILAALVAWHSLAASAAELSVIMTGTVKGDLIVTATGPHERRTRLQFDDRGRGPDVTTTSRFDARGLPLAITVEGVNYAKRPVSERFASEGGRAEWQSSADSGSSSEPGFYVTNESNAEDLAALARALLDAPKHELALLPAGRARIEKVLDHSVTAGAQRATATLYAISGLDLTPSSIWLDGQRELFMSGGTWIAVVRKGFEPALPALLKVQEQATARRLIEATAAMRRTPTKPIVIRNAAVFDAEQRTLRRGLSVRIRGERIEAVGPDATIDRSGAEVIDATGKVLLPGLWDLHVHVLSAEEGPLALLAGLTTVRDLGNDAEALQRLTQQFDDGTVAGPRVLKAGMIDGRGPLAAPSGTLVENAEEMRAAVDAYADRGYRQIKLYSSLPPALVPVGIAEARARGMRVSGHVPAGMTMREAVLAGFDEIQHANFWFLNFMDAETVAHTNSPIRFSAVYEHGWELDLASPQVRDFIALLKEKHTVVDPTLIVFENMFTGWKGEMARWIEPWAPQLPATSLRSARSGGRASTPEQRATYTESFTRMKQMLQALHAAGVPVVPGTDGTALLYARELELHAEAGIAPADVLYDATLGSARVMHEDADSGSVTPGKRADLVLIDGDPLTHISDVRKTTLIIKAGVRYEARALARAAGLQPR
ncbi:MAG TPA: amidohydrolase family protein [Steroidobacteraceae bacterium]|nr:amidohydrolase family protein [Steroidobacteraceae bacterium]